MQLSFKDKNRQLLSCKRHNAVVMIEKEKCGLMFFNHIVAYVCNMPHYAERNIFQVIIDAGILGAEKQESRATVETVDYAWRYNGKL